MTARATRRMSLRARATALGTLAFAVLLGVGAVLLVTTLEDRLTDAADEVARARVAELLDLAASGDLPATLRTGDNGVAQVVGPGGEVLAASANITGRPAVADLPAGADPATATFEAPDDAETETYRFWYAAAPSPEGEVTAYVGDSLESVGEASAALRGALWIGVPLAVAVLGAVIWLLLGRALGRLDRIRAEVDRITEESLDARVSGDGVDDEVGRLAATMNAMLARLDASARRQRDLVADVSHDLQSPLAAQRLAIELALARPDAADVERLGADLLASTADMERLVGDLLVLASVDAGVAHQPALLDLDALVLEEAARARVGASVVVDTTGVSAAPAYADPADVRRIVRNLLTNAITHAATRVAVTVAVEDGWARLDVADDGPGIPAEHRERVFDRFHRMDASRRPGGGSGLGLAIARGLAERGGGRLDLLDPPAPAGGAHLRLLLPAAPA
ncbi:HAMP domain-containing protein [Nocardioides sp. GY 10113]|uniref:sensor histidine kinase n=1 Tax=Nocardioides sp. GY 10113 TaxID=2569761 RepID=UPI0010A8A08C|nr:ATP-binding protein [Nocardioides sp. GY 10113]TIC87455.1 HAMP domain-containing protein [Nocardioides sp. GY 10113]